MPTDTWLSLQLQHLGRTGAVIRALVEDSVGLAVRHLSFDAATASSAPDSLASRTNGAVAPPVSGTALISGVVRGLGDAPLAAVNVGVRGTGVSVRTDAVGHYSLRGLPAGTQVLDVRHLGYDPAETAVELRSDVIVTRDVRLRRIVNLDSVRVVAQRSRYREFSELVSHKLFGIFIGPEEMEWRGRVSYASDVVEKIPGFRVDGEGPRAVVAISRGGFHPPAWSVHRQLRALPRQSLRDEDLQVWPACPPQHGATRPRCTSGVPTLTNTRGGEAASRASRLVASVGRGLTSMLCSPERRRGLQAATRLQQRRIGQSW